MSIRELPLMGALRFRVILERLFAHLIFPAMWGKAGVKFITNNGQKISGEAIPMVVLVTDGVGEGNLGMMTTFCHHDQAKMEASEALSALHQQDSPESCVVVVRRFTNSHYLPLGSFGFLYLEVTTLFRGTSSTRFPLDWLCLCRLLPYSNTEVVLPLEEGEGLKMYPFFQKSEEEHHLSNPILLLVPSLPPILIEKKAPRQRKDLAFTWPYSGCKASTRQESSWNRSWPMKYRDWLGSMKIDGSGWPGGMRNGEPRWLKRQMLPSRRSSLRQSQLT